MLMIIIVIDTEHMHNSTHRFLIVIILVLRKCSNYCMILVVTMIVVITIQIVIMLAIFFNWGVSVEHPKVQGLGFRL